MLKLQVMSSDRNKIKQKTALHAFATQKERMTINALVNKP